MRKLLVLGIIVILGFSNAPGAAAQGQGEPALTLQKAIEKALSENPRLKAAAQRVEVAEGQVRQARLVPNPQIEWEGEEITGDRRGFSQTEHTVSLSQVIELGGKRSSRINSARSGVDVTEIDLEALRLDVLARVTSLYTDAALAQRRLALINESIGLTEKLRQAAQEKVDAGAAPTVEAIRAEVAVSNARLDSVILHAEWTNAKTALAAVWSANQPDFDSVDSALRQEIAPPPLSRLYPYVNDNPDVRRWSAEVNRAQFGLTAARALAVPNVTVSAGPRFLAEDRSQTFVLGLSIPVPIFARNQGDIASFKSAISEAEWLLRAAEVQVRANLSAALQNMGTAYDAIETIRDEIVPAATTAFDEIHRGYGQGRFDYLDLLGAQQDLISARMRHLDALSNYHQQRIEVERFIGSPVSATGGNDGQ